MDEFFDGDENLIKKKTPADGKVKSFNALVEKLKAEGAQLPGRSWMYNSVNLRIEEENLEDSGDKELVHTYGNLNVSHKISLLSVGDLEQKKKLIQEIDEKKLSVRETKERVAALKGKKGARKVAFQNKVSSIHKQLSNWQSQIEKAIKNNSDKKEFQKLNTALKNFIKKIEELEQ